MTKAQGPKPAEIRLTVFECPKCGKRIEALPSSEIRCRCGRAMERRKLADKRRRQTDHTLV